MQDGATDPDEELFQQLRHETPTERLDRNWNDLLQELRVVQTGVQLLTAFLLTLPFQARFDRLSAFQRGEYLVTVGLAVVATGLVIAPVGMHRVMFHRRARRQVVRAAHLFALAGLSTLMLAIVCVALLIFSVVVGIAGGFVAAAVTAVVLSGLWFALPLSRRRVWIEPPARHEGFGAAPDDGAT